MRGWFFIPAAAVLILSGCTREQQAEAGDKAERAGREASRTIARAGRSLADGTITLKVKSAMELSEKLNTRGIDVETVNKVVHLRGTVPDQSQKELAERIARDTVEADIPVINELKVAPDAPKSPERR